MAITEEGTPYGRSSPIDKEGSGWPRIAVSCGACVGLLMVKTCPLPPPRMGATQSGWGSAPTKIHVEPLVTMSTQGAMHPLGRDKQTAVPF